MSAVHLFVPVSVCADASLLTVDSKTFRVGASSWRVSPGTVLPPLRPWRQGEMEAITDSDPTPTFPLHRFSFDGQRQGSSVENGGRR